MIPDKCSRDRGKFRACVTQTWRQTPEICPNQMDSVKSVIVSTPSTVISQRMSRYVDISIITISCVLYSN